MCTAGKWGDSDEIKDELDTAAASCDHFVAMGSEELDMMRLTTRLPTMTGSQRESRCEVLRFVLQTVQQLAMPKNHFFYAVQLLDAAGIWSNFGESPSADRGKHGRTGGEYEVIQRPCARLRSRCLARAC